MWDNRRPLDNQAVYAIDRRIYVIIFSLDKDKLLFPKAVQWHSNSLTSGLQVFDADHYTNSAIHFKNTVLVNRSFFVQDNHLLLVISLLLVVKRHFSLSCVLH